MYRDTKVTYPLSKYISFRILTLLMATCYTHPVDKNSNRERNLQILSRSRTHYDDSARTMR